MGGVEGIKEEGRFSQQRGHMILLAGGDPVLRGTGEKMVFKGRVWDTQRPTTGGKTHAQNNQRFVFSSADSEKL